MPYSRMAWDRLEGINFAKMREYRLARTKEMMKKHNIGTFVTWDAWSIRYICCAYPTVPCRYFESQFCVLPINGGPHMFGITSFSQEQMRREMPWMEGKIWSGQRELKFCDTPDDMKPVVDDIMSIVSEYGLEKEPVAIEGSCHQWMLEEAFKPYGVKLVEGKNCILEARIIKCQEEIECIRMACANADAAFVQMQKNIYPGMTECELMGIGMYELYKRGADEVQEFVLASGPRTNPLHIDFTDRMIRNGDLVVIDVNGNSYMGYKSCYYRTFCCGKATQEQKDIYKECLDMMYAAIDRVKAGVDTGYVTDAWPQDPGYWGYKTWREVGAYATGHGLGLALQEYPFFRPEYTLRSREQGKPLAVLEEGMVVAIETWAGKRGGQDGVRLEEDIVITKDGFDLLTKFPVHEIPECIY